MAREINDAIDGLASVLRHIQGLRIYTYHPDSIQDRGVSAVLTYEGDEQVAIGGSSFQGQITITIVAGPRLTKEVADLFYEMLSPLGNNSIEAAIDADNTWNSKVDDGRIIPGGRVGNIGYRDFPFYPTGPLYAADINTQFVKTVAT